jgi:hypothetical protein
MRSAPQARNRHVATSCSYQSKYLNPSIRVACCSFHEQHKHVTTPKATPWSSSYLTHEQLPQPSVPGLVRHSMPCLPSVSAEAFYLIAFGFGQVFLRYRSADVSLTRPRLDPLETFAAGHFLNLERQPPNSCSNIFTAAECEEQPCHTRVCKGARAARQPDVYVIQEQQRRCHPCHRRRYDHHFYCRQVGCDDVGSCFAAPDDSRVT